MNDVWIYTLVSVALISLISFSGALVIAIRQKYLKDILLILVSFAAGALLGDVFIHLLPELVAESGFNLSISLYILLGVMIFFILEKVVHWRHCHMAAEKDHVHPLGAMNLIGGAVHNFLDGVLIAASYLLSIPVGIATTVAVILHEIPQEMGDFGVLLHSGMKVKKALLFNFLIELVAVVGALLILGLSIEAHSITEFVIPIAIGGFLYIANADLIPELHKEVNPKRSSLQLISLIAGIGIMWLLALNPSHSHAHGNGEVHDDHDSEVHMEHDEDEHHEEEGHHDDDDHDDDHGHE